MSKLGFSELRGTSVGKTLPVKGKKCADVLELLNIGTC